MSPSIRYTGGSADQGDQFGIAFRTNRCKIKASWVCVNLGQCYPVRLFQDSRYHRNNIYVLIPAQANDLPVCVGGTLSIQIPVSVYLNLQCNQSTCISRRHAMMLSFAYLPAFFVAELRVRHCSNKQA